MAQNHIQEGKIMDWTNGSGADVVSGQVVKVGTRVGVALGNIADGEVGRVAVEQVFEVPKATGVAFAQGENAYWDVVDGNFNAVVTDNTLGGYAFEAANTAATTLLLKLNG